MNDPSPLSAATSSAATAADAQSEAPTAIDRVTGATETVEYVADKAATAVNTAQAILAQLPPEVSDSLAASATGLLATAGQVAASNAPQIAAFLGSLCGTAADLLGAIAPAIPFAGAAAAALAKALEQGEAYAQAFKAVHDLRQTIQARRPTIERFVGEASLAAQHAHLVGPAAQALRDAVQLLVQSYSVRSTLRSEVFKFFTAKGRVQTLQDAAGAINVRVNLNPVCCIHFSSFVLLLTQRAAPRSLLAQLATQPLWRAPSS